LKSIQDFRQYCAFFNNRQQFVIIYYNLWVGGPYDAYNPTIQHSCTNKNCINVYALEFECTDEYEIKVYTLDTIVVGKLHVSIQLAASCQVVYPSNKGFHASAMMGINIQYESLETWLYY
jgi:hypothetical protein